MVLATSSLVVWHDHPSGSFPPGDHVFAADLEPATELAAALRADLSETHLVPVAQLRAEPPEPHPLRLTALQAFLARWGARLDERIGSSGVIANTREHGRRRVAALRALGAPTVVVEREAAELARVSSPAWRPTIVPARLVPDVIGAASLVGAGTHPLDGPLAIDADVSDLVLLAAACCVSLDAEEVREPWIDALADSMAWSSLLDVELADSPIPEGFVRVRPGVYAHEVEALALADTRHVPHAPPTGTLLRVVIPTA